MIIILLLVVVVVLLLQIRNKVVPPKPKLPLTRFGRIAKYVGFAVFGIMWFAVALMYFTANP